MIKRHISEIAQIVNGKLFLPNGFSDFEIEQVITDSRTYNGESTSLFIALKGLRTDGHHFVHDMIEKGLNACIVSDPAVIYS
ncbi:MAG: Mur ligase domain-containing protein, partial [Mariniphaga sp.]|nr:Mur ligase domain-containing protein [Mariniphaga sp.]